MYISNNRSSFHLWWKEKLVIHQKVSNYYETDCLQNFLLLFMFLLRIKCLKNTHIYVRNVFFFLKNVLKQTWNSFNIRFQPYQKGRKSSCLVKPILWFLCHLIHLILDSKSVKGLRVTENVKAIKFRYNEKRFAETITHKIFKVRLKSSQREKFNICFWRAFC